MPCSRRLIAVETIISARIALELPDVIKRFFMLHAGTT
jgi:hypothetical protein